MQEIKIHFIHGSTRKNKYSRKSSRLFGIFGGHVLVQVEDTVYSFSYKDKMNRIWPRTVNKNGKFKIEHYPDWIEKVSWEKRTTITTLVNPDQLQRMHNLIEQYKTELPFDYAFFGERCCSIHFKLLATAEIIKDSKLRLLISAIPTFYIYYFKRLMKSPVLQVERVKGCDTRIWF